LLQDFGEERDGQMIRPGDVFRAGRRARYGGEVAKSDQPVIRFFGQLEHRMKTFIVLYV
jgi:hypothetical protein